MAGNKVEEPYTLYQTLFAYKSTDEGDLNFEGGEIIRFVKNKEGKKMTAASRVPAEYTTTRATGSRARTRTASAAPSPVGLARKLFVY